MHIFTVRTQTTSLDVMGLKLKGRDVQVTGSTGREGGGKDGAALTATGPEVPDALLDCGCHLR